MTISVVIPAYNGLSFLQSNLVQIMALKPTEVIIVDDASTDGSADYIAAHFPTIHLIRRTHNSGFPATVNLGFAASSADIVVLLNQDVVPSRGLLSVIKPYFSDPRLFAVTFNENHRSWAKVALHHGLLDYTNGPIDSSDHQSFWASGGSAAFRKSHWDNLGGFDTLFSPGYLEDLDLGYRARKRGYTIVWSAQAIVHHTPESTFNRTYAPRRLNHIKDRNFLLVHWKNLDSPNLLPHFFSLLDRILQHPGFIIPFFMAAKHLPKIISFRRSEKAHTILTDKKIFINV